MSVVNKLSQIMGTVLFHKYFKISLVVFFFRILFKHKRGFIKVTATIFCFGCNSPPVSVTLYFGISLVFKTF